MLKKILVLLLFTGSLSACGDNRTENERPEPVIETEIDIDETSESDTLSPADTLVVPRGTGENI